MFLVAIGERIDLVFVKQPRESAATGGDVVVPPDSAKRSVLKRYRKTRIHMV